MVWALIFGKINGSINFQAIVQAFYVLSNQHYEGIKLFKTEGRSWNKDMLKEVIQLKVVSMILNIHLSYLPKPNKLIWGDLEIGQFSVKSAYYHRETSHYMMFECNLSQVVWNRIYPSLNEFVFRNAWQANFLQTMFEMMIKDEIVEECVVTF